MSIVLQLRPDGPITEISLPDSDIARLAALHRTIACTVLDVLPLNVRTDVYFDADAHDSGQPINPIATALLRRNGYPWQQCRGLVVLCAHTPEGAPIDLPLAQSGQLLAPQ
ncbi:hypothetical protein [Streptomonospora litoralis]|uniref:Uncharacterized protein n=1 Tax=Streptomonospora litoralis TaxID=2498135 RepID=A0A4P6Q8H3_9ACTN|nr:hypothetical protein [Streptomonospora litoralis]QBI56760.1 hypothetical protein EKD16_25095 [Streptomonospora litoralis]